MKTIQVYRFALDLTPVQERAVLAHAGAARVAHNWALARVKAVMDQRAAERTYGFCVEVDRAERRPARPASVVGVDVGITHLAVLSTGELVDNPRHLAAAQTRLRYLGRALSRKTGPDRRTRRRPSNRWQRASDRLARAHTRVANLRRDGLHKLTTRLAREHGTVVVEDLNVAGMIRNRRLARHIADAGFGELRRQLAYKTEWNGGRLVVADRWYPSSKTCSGCGAAKAKLALSERTYTCTTCGLILDRDLNAARNLAALAAETTTAGSGSVAGRGADQKTRPRGQVAVKRQPGTASAGQTGTVPPQGRTTDRAHARAH